MMYEIKITPVLNGRIVSNWKGTRVFRTTDAAIEAIKTDLLVLETHCRIELVKDAEERQP